MTVTEDPKPLIHTDEVQKDRERKKQLVVDVITSHANESSEFEEITAIGESLKAGAKLNIEVISGGVTNFSYRVECGKLADAPEIRLYAKIVFPYALWSLEKTPNYDVNRAANEVKAMRHFKDLMGEDAPVATPYICEAVEDMMLFVTSWAPADEQWANQFIDGEIDGRIVPQLAESLATLNLAPLRGEFGADFNDGVRPTMMGMMQVVRQVAAGLFASQDPVPDACVSYLRELGQERFFELMEKLEEKYNTRECINHSDTHVFNILVERKPEIEELQSFGTRGAFAICDWEMSMAGPYGRDAGIFQAFPVGCAFFHACGGHKQVAYNIVNCTFDFWNKYADTLRTKGGKDDMFLLDACRTSIGFMSKYLLNAHYILGLYCEFFPSESLSAEMAARARGSMGVVGLKAMEYGFGNKELDLSLEDLRRRYEALITDEIDSLVEAASACSVRPRRMSVLRKNGRRVSDAGFLEEAVRHAAADSKSRLSLCSTTEKSRETI